MKTKKLLLFLWCFIAIFITHLSVNAEESNPLDSATSLSLNQMLTGAFDVTELSYTYYKIEISQKSPITIYGNNTGEGEILLELDDSNGKYVTNQYNSISVNSNYIWRTKELNPGIYYIKVSSQFSKINYTISYTYDPYPVYKDLSENEKIDYQTGYNIFKINIPSSTAITIYGEQNKGDYVSLELSDANGNHVSHQSLASTISSTYKWRTNTLTPGVYYIIASCSKNYTLTYSTEPYPESIPLDRGNTLTGNFNNSNSKVLYKINITEKQRITCFVTKDVTSYIGLTLLDSDSMSVAHMGEALDDLSISWSPDKELSPGTYYLEVSAIDLDNINYTITWQISGPSAVENLKLSKTTGKSITLKWGAPADASKYKVYIYNSNSKNYSLYKTTTSKSCKISGLKPNSIYTFKVIPVMIKNGEDIDGEETVFKAATTPSKAKIQSIKKTASSTLSGVPVNYYKIRWKKVKKASGYQIYVKTKGSKWKMIDYTSSRTTDIYIVKGFSGQIKVRAYISTDDATTYGPFSKVKTVKSN